MTTDQHTTTTICRHCGREIKYSPSDGWFDPNATGDDRIWRETCDQHDTRMAEHEPTPTPKRGAIYMTGTDYDDAYNNLFGDTGTMIQGTGDIEIAQEWADAEDGLRIFAFVIDVHHATERDDQS